MITRLEHLPALFWPILIATALVLGLAWAGYRRWWRPHRQRVARKKAIAQAARDVLWNVILPDGADGWFHLDALLLTEQGLVVLDIRDWDGLIYGSETMLEWTVIHAKGRHTIPNPLGALYDRIAVVRSLIAEDVPVEGRVLFGLNATYPKGRPHWVSVLTQLHTELNHSKASFNDGWLESWDKLKSQATPSPHRVI